MQTPRLRWEININTIAVILGFAGGLVAWGYTLSEMTTGLETNARDIDNLSERVVAVERSIRILDNHELRLSNVERQAVDASAAMREVNTTLNSLAADMKVTREILQRIEAAQNGRRPP